MRLVFSILFFFLCSGQVQAQTLNTSNVQIEWKVANRFRLFNDPALFKTHESAWQQYLLHIDGQSISEDQKQRLAQTSAVLGTEHVLNDRHIAFTRILRQKYDWRGWGAKGEGRLCWDPSSRTHKACGGIEDYINPTTHDVEISLRPLNKKLPLKELDCQWRVGDGEPLEAPCDTLVTASLPYPSGASISVNVIGEQPVIINAVVKDLLIVGLGDSFASGEGNPDLPVAFQSAQRNRNLYPKRARNDGAGSATWTDQLCHRSLYGHQLRAALQIAVENPRAAVTFLGFSCSGAAVEAGILGPQNYVEYVTTRPSAAKPADQNVAARALSGGSKDAQMYWLLRELCKTKPKQNDGVWTCPDQQYRRSVDYVFLSIGGNDIGFANLVAWATLREGTTATLAKYLGATVSAKQFAGNMREILPGAYAKLAKAIARSIPIDADGQGFDASRVVLTAYPDILADENGNACPAPEQEGEREDSYTANQSLDYFRAWLAVTSGRLNAAKDQLETLHNRMGELAEDHGWTFAGRAYADKPFRGHGFCAQKTDLALDPPEVLMMPCAGTAGRDTQTCETSWSGKEKNWRPYNPENQNYPYALRQRWVRTFNDAYMTINQKVVDRSGNIDEDTSAAIFSETTGAMHPSAEGHAAMADAILMDIRKDIAKLFSDP